MDLKEQVRLFVKGAYSICEDYKGNTFLRFGLQELTGDPPFTILCQLNWGEQVLVRVIGSLTEEGLKQFEDRLADEFIHRWWGILVGRERKNPYRRPLRVIPYEGWELFKDD